MGGFFNRFDDGSLCIQAYSSRSCSLREVDTVVLTRWVCRIPGRRAAGKWCRAITALLAGVCAGGSLWAQAVPGPCAPPGRSGYVGQAVPSQASAVVFVHGVLGSPADTWGADPAQSWPCLLRQEASFDSSSIWVYGYDSALAGPSPSIQRVAEQMLSELVADDVFRHTRLTIVAHSMGGLVTSRLLLLMQERPDLRALLPRIRLVMFYGTPAKGSEIADIAAVFSSNTQFEEMKARAEPGELLQRWSAVRWPFKWYCLAEGQRTGIAFEAGFFPALNPFGWKIVDESSASALCAGRAHPADVLNADHRTIVKPAGLGGSSHLHLRRRFRSCVSDAVPRSVPASQVGTTDGQLMVDMVSAVRAGLRSDAATGAIPATAIPAVLAATANYSGSLSDTFFFPHDPQQPSLLARDFDKLDRRRFSHEVSKLFVDRAVEFSPAWIGRLPGLASYAADGMWTETHRSWISSGEISDDDWAIVLPPRTGLGQPVLVGMIQQAEGGRRVGRLRGLLILPEQPSTCGD